jgi:hypothetical protein
MVNRPGGQGGPRLEAETGTTVKNGIVAVSHGRDRSSALRLCARVRKLGL